MVFFQAALLAGYSYSNKLSRIQNPLVQVVVHVIVLFLPFLFLPISIPGGWSPPLETSPIPWFLALLTISIGLPFFAVATTAPLLQHWFSRTNHPMAHDPYFLYSASNLGCLLALLGYPALVEPNLTLFQQGRFWAYGYGLLVLLNIMCMVLLLKNLNASRDISQR